MDHRLSMKTGIAWLLTLCLLLLLMGGGILGLVTRPVQASAPGDELFSASGHLSPDEVHEPGFPVFTARNVNLKLYVPPVAGDGTIDLTFIDGTGANTFNGTIQDGETLWASVALKPGANNNTFQLENTSGLAGPDLDYQLWVYEVDNAPFAWSGGSQGGGTWRSHIKATFPASGLYEFSFSKTSGRYQFFVDNEHVQKTVDANGAVSYYVAAGVHDLRIEPDTAAAQTAWALNISGPGAAADTLPYVKTGGNLGGTGNDFDEEWLPINLDGATVANLKLKLTGGDSDNSLLVRLHGATGSVAAPAGTVVRGGETLWWTSDLPAGLSRIQLEADSGNNDALAYELTVNAKPSVPANWAGVSNKNGGNSKVRFEVDTAGLYDLTYTNDSGRYQFLVNSDPHIQKTVEGDGSVRYYLGAGTHELTVVQDTGQGAEWSLAIAATGTTHDALPYHKVGGDLGGGGNDFDEEWLPLNAESGGPANFELTLDGALADGLKAYLYQGGTQVDATPTVYGGETFWWTADLVAGVNQVKLEAEGGNGNALEYDLTIHTVAATPVTWSGVAKGGAGNSAALVNIPADGTYRVTLDTPAGFAQVHIDKASLMAGPGTNAPGHTTEFDVPLSAGNHSFAVIQDAAYATTGWTVNVASTAADETIAHFAGDLAAGVQVNPQLPLFGAQNKEVNFRLAVSGGGGPLALTIKDGLGGTAFTGTAYNGETVWGTALLKPGQNTFELHNTGGSTLTYDLIVYEIGTAPYDWTGVSAAVGAWDSHVKLNFAADALYDFDFGVATGRYQFLVDGEYVQKTAEADGQVSYYIPSGEHTLKVVPDRTGANTSWTLDTSGAGAATDVLPYVKAGGNLWASAAQFNEEWLPVNLAAATPTNFKLTLTGTAGDKLDVYLYGGATGNTIIESVTGIYVGETLWWSKDLPAGVSRIKLEADAGNTGSVAYELTVNEKPTVPASWAGVSDKDGNNSMVRFEVATAGLYDFTYGITSGRYQFLVNSEPHIRKTVESNGTVRYYLAAGTHELTVMQDTTLGASWSLAIAATGETYDALPYHKDGGNLGGGGNDFTEEWLPLNMEGSGAANFELTLDGDLADGLTAYLYQGGTPVYTTPVVFGGETFWWTADLVAGVNQVKLLTEGGNTNALEYDLTIHSVPMVASGASHTWSGLSKGNPAPVGNSEVELQLPVDGTYHVVLDIPHGYATVHIADAATLARSTMQSHIEFDVPLDEGGYLFEVQQSAAYITTTWAITVSLKAAPAPQITSIDPVSVTNEAPHALAINGANFQPGADVHIDGIALSPVTRLGSTTLQTQIPAGLATGTYTVTVTNPDDQAASLTDALLVVNPAPKVMAVTPVSGTNDVTMPITISGEFFMATPVVMLDEHALSNVTWLSATTLTAVVPAGLAEGVYDLTVKNPDQQQDTLADAFEVLPPPTYYYYMPTIFKNSQ